MFLSSESSHPLASLPDECFFPDRTEECARIVRFLAGPNNLILTAPKGFGKTNLVLKAACTTGRPFVYVDVGAALSVIDLASLLLRGFLSLFPRERFRELVTGLRAWPTLAYDAETDAWDVSFPAAANPDAVLEDVFAVLEKNFGPERRLVVIFDEFQEILSLAPGLDGKLRAILELQKNVNCVFVGSRVNVMSDLFEKVRSPFFHFGFVMRLESLPRDEIALRLTDRWAPVAKDKTAELVDKLLALTNARPQYARMLAEAVEEALRRKAEDPLSFALDLLLHLRDPDYGRRWRRLNLTNRKVLEAVSRGAPLHTVPERESTVYTAAGRLVRDGVLVRTSRYEVEDPFFALWIRRQRLSAVRFSASPDF